MKKYSKFIPFAVVIIAFLSYSLLKKSTTLPAKTSDQAQNRTGGIQDVPSGFDNEVYTAPQIISVSPEDKETDVAVNSTLTITFDRAVDPSELEFSIRPETAVGLNIEGNTQNAVPDFSFAEGTTYTYIVKYPDSATQSQTYSFTTAGELKPLPDTRDEQAVKRENEFQRANHPDVYLANRLPYSTASFEASAVYDNDSTSPGFVFTVTVKSPSGRDDFRNWVLNSGLTATQLDNLDFRYY